MILLALLFSLLASTVEAANYYVATTGSDTTGTGAADNPWRNPEKCVSSGTPIVAGDTCIVRSGTYSNTVTTGIVVYIRSTAPLGTAANPITIKSEVPGGAIIQVPTLVNTSNNGFQVGRSYYVIEGFKIQGGGASGGTTGGSAGIRVSANNTTIRRNEITEQGWGVCSNSSNANAGIQVQNNIANTLIEYNRLHKIGRLRNGESGCSTTHFQHDHAIYASSGTNLTVRHNVVYNANRGYAFTLYRSGGSTIVHDTVKVENNTFHGSSPDGFGPFGQINICNTSRNVSIRNNIFSAPKLGYLMQWCAAGTVLTNTVIDHNLISTSVNPAVNPSPDLTGTYTYTNNLHNTSPGVVSTTLGSEDFRLTSSSAAINAGINVGLPYSGSAPDIGAFETHGPVSASITASLLDVTYSTAHGPIQVGGAAGHSIGCSPTCGTITVANASLFSSADSIVRYTASGFSGGNCVDTQTITKSFNASTGTLTDSINIGGTLNQPVHSYGPIAVTNQCDGGGSPTPPGSPHRLYELDGNGNDTSGNAGHATVSGGSFVAGKYGQALQGTDGTAVSATSDYGSGVNPSTQDLTIIFGYEVPAGATGLTRTVAGSSIGTDQRLHISAQSGTWQIAIGDSSTSSGTPSNLPVVEGYNRLCLRLDSTANVATLTANNVTGTGGATKVIPNYTLASNIAFGLPSGFNAVVAGGGKWDKAAIYTSLVSCNDDWLAWEPPSSPPVGTYAQTGARWLRVMDDGASGAIIYSTASTVNVVQGGAIIYQSQTDCTVAACSAIGEKLWYTKNGGTAQEVPNVFTSDGVSFWGVNTSEHMYLGAATCCISGALTANNGTTQTTNVAQPTIELAQDASIVRNSVLRFASDATGTYCFHERDQNGNELDSVPTACVVLIPPQANGAH